ncbi:hypothetical protein RBSWK_01576 [Rhodopirellula baltica SWK14]|uniref:Uncharacterized protein n=1 Tax=Rhodopirellula baltica SWK14 TaxID=993516 RepID=L7CKZ3_RHOBT|nr:hypothetical protein RBSWK_01576 [Rhodopirellula baltica SWK14]
MKHAVLGASGGSYYVHYRAEVDLAAETSVTVELMSLQGERKPDDLSRASIVAIRQAAERVLTRFKVGGQIKIHDLGIHDVDCNPRQYDRWTERILTAKLEELYPDPEVG